MKRPLTIVTIVVGWSICLVYFPSTRASTGMSDHIFTKPEDFDGEAARRFATLVAAGKVTDAIAAGQQAPDGLNTYGRNGASAVEIAVEHDDKPMLSALLKAGANPNGAPDAAPIIMACNYDDLTMAKMLIAAGADPNGISGGEYVLASAALINAQPAVSLLLAAGARIDQVDSVGTTALMTAALADHWITVGLLLDHSASIWPASSTGDTIAAIAARTKLLPNNPDGVALPKVIERLKALGSPWPPPTAADVKQLRAGGQWPPKQAIRD